MSNNRFSRIQCVKPDPQSGICDSFLENGGTFSNLSVTTDIGVATAVSGMLLMPGGGGIQTTGAGNTVTVTDLRNLSPFVVGLSGADSQFTSIQAAIDAAFAEFTASSNTQTVFIKAGQYIEDLNFRSGVVVQGISSSENPINVVPDIAITGNHTVAIGESPILANLLLIITNGSPLITNNGSVVTMNNMIMIQTGAGTLFTNNFAGCNLIFNQCFAIGTIDFSSFSGQFDVFDSSVGGVILLTSDGCRCTFRNSRFFGGNITLSSTLDSSFIDARYCEFGSIDSVLTIDLGTVFAFRSVLFDCIIFSNLNVINMSVLLIYGCVFRRSLTSTGLPIIELHDNAAVEIINTRILSFQLAALSLLDSAGCNIKNCEISSPAESTDSNPGTITLKAGTSIVQIENSSIINNPSAGFSPGFAMELELGTNATIANCGITCSNAVASIDNNSGNSFFNGGCFRMNGSTLGISAGGVALTPL